MFSVSEYISNVSYHFLTHFSVSGTQISEICTPGISKIIIPNQKVQSLQASSIHSSENPRHFGAHIDNSFEAERKFLDKVKCDSNGKIQWFKTPPLFVSFKERYSPSVDFSLWSKEKNIRKIKRKPPRHFTFKREIEIPSSDQLNGKSFLFTF